MSTEVHKPIIAFTVGDINGVGPELIMRAFSHKNILNICTPVIYGSGRVFSFYKKALNLNEFSYKQINSIEQIDHRKVNLINCWEEELNLTPGQSTSLGGKASWLSLKEASKAWVDGQVDALVTAPINKSNIQSEDFKFPGHTGYLTELAGQKKSLMLMTSPRLKMGVVTEHVSLKEVTSELSKSLIIDKALILNTTLKNDFGIQRPKIAVLGVNPHAGDNGLLGDEEQKIIMPALNVLKEKEVLAFGPFSADGFFGTMQYRNYDGVLAIDLKGINP